MTAETIDLRDFMSEGTAFPVPSWDLVAARIEANIPEEQQFDCWTDMGRQWLSLINACFDNSYDFEETENFLLLGLLREDSLKAVGRFAEHCRVGIEYGLPDIANFSSPGKSIILIIAGSDNYYTHIADYWSDGEWGLSAGVHIRTRYPHVAVLESPRYQLNQILAHELTHAAVHHLNLPLWIEEGMTQMFECDLASRAVDLDNKEIASQKKFWRENGLDAFWSGASFYAADESQRYSYQLAEFLIRILLSDYRARWFGFDRRPVLKLKRFFQESRLEDAGEAAAIEHLGLTLKELAAKSIGK